MATCGAFGLATGVLVLIGWHSGYILSSTAVAFDSVPVRYNAGVCFVFCGLALLLLARGQLGWGRALAAPAAALGLLTACEYIFSANLGIDELLFRSTRISSAVPPRMAPNSAACFTLLGGILLLAGRGEQRLGNTLQAFAAALVVATGLVGVIGYAAKLPTAYGWGRFTPMAAPTAVVIASLGLGVVAFAWRQQLVTSRGMPAWLPPLAGLTLAAASAVLSQALHVLHPLQKLDSVALGVGAAQAALVYLVLRLLRGSGEGAEQLRVLNSRLQAQMSSLERAERELRATQAYTRSLIEASLDPLVTISPDGKITDVNAATEAATGCSRHKLIGTDFCDYFTEPGQARAGYQQVFREGGVRDYELEIRHREGRITPVLYNASIYHDEAGAVVGVFAAARDITERKKRDQALRWSDERYRALLTAIAQVVWTTPPGGAVEDMPMWRQYTGQSLEQVRGWGWLEAVHPDDRERTAAIWAQALETRGIYETEYRIRSADGQYRHFAIRGVPVLQEDGGVREWVGICTDIHERKQLEDRLRQRTLELENSVAELEAFSYSVSHDLRAPLRSIDGFSQILLEDYQEKVDAEGQDSLRRIRAASQNMGQLIDALLQLSRVMRSELQRETVDLSVLALATAAVVQKADPGRRVRFHIANGLQVRGDRRLLAVALQNLLQNAWKFTARNPQPSIEFGSTQREGKTAYYVRDNGIGFDMAYVGKLFTPFQRLHSKEQFEGTGIGLATVQRVIKRHGGKVWAEGAVGKGATFYFTLD